jgi:hypothetical protein
MASANVLEKYAGLTPEKRIDYICKNYARFMGIIESYTQGLIYMIEEEQDFNRREEKGDLGVRIQGGGYHSDRTANQAIRNVSLRDAIIACDFSDGVLDDTDHDEEFMRDAAVLRQMRRDYELFNSQMKQLKENDMLLIQSVLMKEKDLTTIADERGIQYESAYQRVRRIKKEIKTNMFAFVSMSYVSREAL